jgi:hypothetical protein
LKTTSGTKFFEAAVPICGGVARNATAHAAAAATAVRGFVDMKAALVSRVIVARQAVETGRQYTPEAESLRITLCTK